MAHEWETFNDRFYIEKRLAAKASIYQIAQELEVHHSTVRREIRRAIPTRNSTGCILLAGLKPWRESGGG
ncbi:helix-turn-helix domain-containing protein [Candidatus Regiella insecticola]|uniref:helix-turn-helix domain-containing protein n=1 Tax=Candidatus Regiella insecticola TaxID=138073 RepID=UPI00387EE418